MTIMRAGLFTMIIGAGCGGGGHGSPDAPDVVVDAAVDGPILTMNVTGTGIEHHVTDTGVVDLPRDFSQKIIVSSVTPRGTAFDRHTGTGAADGTFTVPVDQDASVWDIRLDFGGGGRPYFLVGNQTSLDLSFNTMGRIDAAFPANSTPVGLEITGMDAWQDTDDMEIMSSNVGAVVFGVPFSLDAPPTAGDTTITANNLDWSFQGTPLVVAAKGDKTSVYQLGTKTSGADPYQAITKLGTSTTFTQTDGQASTLTVALTAVAANKSLTTHWKRSQYEAFLGSVGPGAVDGTQVLAIDALPDAATRGFYASAPDLVEFFTSGTTDIDDTFAYGNPFSTAGVAWQEFAIMNYNFNVPITASGATNPFNFSAGIFENVPLASLTGGNITPRISPVRNVKIAGKDAFTPQTAVGLAPAVTWDAPVTGTTTSYLVAVFRIDRNGDNTKRTSVGVLQTSATSVQLPDNLLTTGSSFVVTVAAVSQPGQSDAIPFHDSLPDATSLVVSAIFTP